MSERLYKRYLLGLLAVILGFNGVDRLFLGLVLQDVKVDLFLNDTQLGFLTGAAFALFYSVMGLPISRLADRGNRVVIMSITTGLWGVALVLSSFSESFAQLVSIRVFVAVGEAGCLPLALSLIADYFPRAERPRAVATYMLGQSLSVVVGLFVGGWLSQFYGWRSSMAILGLPGIILAPLVWFTLREPRRQQTQQQRPQETHPSMKEVCVVLWNTRAFRLLLIAYTVACFFNSAIAHWQPAFLVRSFGLRSGEMGTWMAIIYSSSLLAGNYLSGQWVSRKAVNNEPLQLKSMGIACCVMGLLSALIYVSPTRYWAFLFMGLWNLAGNTTMGPLFATMQTLVQDRMRATAITLVLLCANLIGVGLGPVVAGALSDGLHQWLGSESLRYTLLLLSPGFAGTGWYLWQASKFVAKDVDRIHGVQGAHANSLSEAGMTSEDSEAVFHT